MCLQIDRINTTVTELSEAQEIEHEQMMQVSDYYCRDCDEYWLMENMRLIREPHGSYTAVCPNGMEHALEDCDV